MKIFLTCLVVCVVIFAAGCGSESEKKIGVIRHMNVTEAAFTRLSERIDDTDSAPGKSRYIFFDSMTEMTAALQSGQIDVLSTYEVVGDYLEAHNPDFECVDYKPEFADAFCCAMREEDLALKKQFSDAIDNIITDGTLKRLVKNYIVDANHVDPPAAVEMPTFYSDEYDDDYAPTLKIGVTGDMPPLDFVRSDGLPAGFNTALLAEISKRLKMNFTLVPLEGGARAAALASKRVDVIFWVIVPTYAEIPIDVDKPEGTILTDAYFTDEIVRVRLKQTR